MCVCVFYQERVQPGAAQKCSMAEKHKGQEGRCLSVGVGVYTSGRRSFRLLMGCFALEESVPVGRGGGNTNGHYSTHRLTAAAWGRHSGTRDSFTSSSNHRCHHGNAWRFPLFHLGNIRASLFEFRADLHLLTRSNFHLLVTL